MGTAEIRIPHSEIADPQTITQVQREHYRKNGLDMSMNDVVKLDDNFAQKERVIQVKNRVNIYIVPELPWHNK